MNLSKIQSKVAPAINKFVNFEFVKCLSQGCTAALSVIMIGSIFTMLKTPPVPAGTTNAFLLAWAEFSKANQSWLALGTQFSMDFMGLYTAIATVVALCQIQKKRPTNYIIIALFSFFVLCTPMVEKTLDVGWLASKGMFPAVIISYLVTKLLIFLQDKGLKVKLPDVVPPSIADPLTSLFANMGVAAVVIAVYLIFGALGTTVPELINNIFKPLFMATDSLPAVILYVLVCRLLWFFGIHGDNIGKAVVRPILAANLAANAEAWAAGETVMPHIFTQAFNFWTYTPYLAIALALLLAARSAQNKAIAKVVVGPAFFNISEPITFGIPLVLNFSLLLPTLFVFALDVTVPYILYMMNLLQTPYLSVIGCVPCIFLSFLTSFDIKNVILYLVLMAADIAILYPFFRKYDQKILEKEQTATAAN